MMQEKLWRRLGCNDAKGVRMLKALIPIDGSEFSQSVFGDVKKLLSPNMYSLTLLEVAPIPEELEEVRNGVPATWAAQVGYGKVSDEMRRALEPDRSAFIDRAWQDNERKVLTTMDDARAQLERAGFNVETAVCFGDPADEISDFVNYRHMDIVVMATHGRSGLGRVVMGSVAEKVLRSLHVPVMMVRPVREVESEVLPIAEIADAMA
jgi:nucleotide-binding universal stress UspA family protein